VNGSDVPQIYQWLTDALVRAGDLSEARAMLEEATGKWPTDTRFTRPLALMYATFGRGREAVRTLERYLAENPTDRDACLMEVQWLYTVHAAGAVVHNRTEDLKLARAYADAYAQAGGPQAALVRQWVEFLEKEGR
jgi:predicted Zn-dependent protease